MAVEFRMLGTVVKVTSTLTLTVSIDLSDGNGHTTTLDSGDAAYQTIDTGTYRICDFAQLVASKLLTWITAAKAAAVTALTLDSTGSPSVTLAFTPSTSAGGSLFSLSFGPIGATFHTGGLNAAIVGATIGNTTGAYTPLGLAYETDTSVSAVAASGTVSWAGKFQPRSIFVFSRSEVDEGDAEEPSVYKALRHADGSISTFESGRRVTTRSLRLVDLDESVTGRAFPIGRYSSFGANQATLAISNPSVASLSGISGLYVDTSLPTVGAYAQVGGYVSRIRSVGSTSIVLCEKIPTTLTVPAASAICQVSEAHALWIEAMRTGYLICYGPPIDGSSTLRWLSEEYAISGAQTPRYLGERRDAGVPIYSYTFNLLRRDASGLTTV